MSNLKTRYLGMDLKNPIIAGASGFTGNIKSLKKIEKAGASAVVLKSLFEEQITYEVNQSLKKGGIVYGYDDIDDYVGFYEKKYNVTKYSQLINEAKNSLSIPVIASINCATSSDWTSFAKSVEEAGADALQLNMFILPFDLRKSGGEIEEEYVNTVKAVRKEIDIPLSIKLSYHFSNIFQLIHRLSDAGADGFVLFNRFFSPDLDINTLEYTSSKFFSSPDENNLAFRWIGMLYGRINGSLASSTGVHSGEDLIKMILAGADTSEIVSTMYKHKPEVILSMLETLDKWMEEKSFKTISDFKGIMSQKDSFNPEIYNRIQYMKHYGELKK